MAARQQSELHETELGRLAEKTLPFFETYGNRIILGLAAILFVAAAVIWWTRSSSAAAAVGWTELAAARSAEDYANVADDFAGTEVGNWARLIEADSYRSSGIQLSFSDREAGVAELKQAREAYEMLLGKSLVDPRITEKALFGMARTLEATCDGDTSEAVAAYSRLLSDFPESDYKSLAEARITSLETDEAKEFYAWFHKQNPKPEDIKTPADGLPPGHPPVAPGDVPVFLPQTPGLLQGLEPETPSEGDETPDASAGDSSDSSDESSTSSDATESSDKEDSADDGENSDATPTDDAEQKEETPEDSSSEADQ